MIIVHRLIKKTLETIEKKGYEAYIVGGYTKDMKPTLSVVMSVTFY